MVAMMKKQEKTVKWANNGYYLTYEKNMVFIYDMKGPINKECKIELVNFRLSNSIEQIFQNINTTYILEQFQVDLNTPT